MRLDAFACWPERLTSQAERLAGRRLADRSGKHRLSIDNEYGHLVAIAIREPGTAVHIDDRHGALEAVQESFGVLAEVADSPHVQGA